MVQFNPWRGLLEGWPLPGGDGRNCRGPRARGAEREHFAEPELERVAGEVLILMGAENAIEAEQCLRHAVVIAAEQRRKIVGVAGDHEPRAIVAR